MKVKFWVAVGIVKQMTFRDDGSTAEIEKEHPRGEQHIVYSEVLMCRQSRDTLMKKVDATKKKVVQQRIEGVPVCQKCEKAYREHPDLAFRKWVESPEPKRDSTVKINPILHGINSEER